MRAEVVVYDDRGETVKVFIVRSRSVVMLKKKIGELAFLDFLGENIEKMKLWRKEQR